MNKDTLSLGWGEWAAYLVWSTFTVVGLFYLFFTHLIFGYFVPFFLYLFWAAYFLIVLHMFRMRTFEEPVEPVPEDRREFFEQIARQRGVAFQGIWRYSEPQPDDDLKEWGIKLLGLLPGRFHLFVDFDGFDQYSPEKQKFKLLYQIEMFARKRWGMKHLILCFFIYTAYLIYYYATLWPRHPLSLWLDITPVVLSVIGVCVVFVHAYLEVFDIDRAVYSEVSPQVAIERLEHRREEVIQLDERQTILKRFIGWYAIKRINKLESSIGGETPNE